MAIASDLTYRLVTAADQPDFFEAVTTVVRESYPKFLTQDFLTSDDWHRLFQLYPEFQFGLIETTTQRMVAQGNCLPLPWHQPLEKLPDTGCDWAFTTGLTAAGKPPNVLSAASLSVLPEYQGKGLSGYLLDHMQTLGRSHHLDTLILAARPSLKHLYPLTSIEHYLNWTDANGLPFDPWLRTNLKRGARLINLCAQSTTIIDTVSAWEQKTEMRLPETGNYIIPGALVPLQIDYATDQGTYIEPNVWLSYTLS
jgi:GNAT superfamily N-acetyltransferase